MEHALLLEILLLLLLVSVVVAACHQLGLSSIVGYLGAGVLAGPHLLGWLPDASHIRFLAELGVVLLMFTLGLEFSLPRLLASKTLVLGLGSAQVVITGLVFGALAWLLGVPASGAFALAGALAMSSTAIVLKQLGEQMELPASHGRVAVAILLFQDLATVPLLVVLSSLAGEQANHIALELGRALLSAGLVFILLLVAGRRILPGVLHGVAAMRSAELFMLVNLVMALAAAGLSALVGLSPALGAFMAGMLLGETPFRHQVETDIRPFRDLMLGLFFVTIGLQLNVPSVLEQFHWVLLLLFGMIAVKLGLLVALIRAFKQSITTAWRGALSLAHGGEFGLLLVSTAISLQLLPAEIGQPLLAVLIFSMILAPVLVRFNGPLMAWLLHRQAFTGTQDIETYLTEQSADYTNHIIICGYGRLGRSLAGVLAQEGITSLALDLDPERVRQAAAADEPVLFGDAYKPDILRATGLARARGVAITLEDSRRARQIAQQVKLLQPGLPVLVRSAVGEDEQALGAMGATVFPESFELSLLFAGQLMVLLGIPHSRVETHLNDIRSDDYALLRAFLQAEETETSASSQAESVCSIILREQDYAAGRTLDELALPTRHIQLLNVLRGGIRVPGELLDTRLRPGDVLVLSGTGDDLQRVRHWLREGCPEDS